MANNEHLELLNEIGKIETNEKKTNPEIIGAPYAADIKDIYL